MFEELMGRAALAAEARARVRAAALADRLGAALPRGIEAAASPDGVVLWGRGIARRFALEPALRWLTLA